MGICASSQFTRNIMVSCSNGISSSSSSSSTAKVIHSDDGRLQEFRHRIRATHVLSDHPNTFLCSSDNMYVNCHVPQVPHDEELQLGQIYFLMPFSNSNKPLSLQELCSLAIKASSALGQTSKKKNKANAKYVNVPFKIYKTYGNGNGNVRLTE